MRIRRILFFLVMFFSISGRTQEAKISKIPSVQIKTMEGKSVNTLTFSNNGKPMVIDFWATWCVPCVMELNAIADKYEYWRRETGVKIIIVAVDTVHNTTTVSSFVKNKGWQYEVYLDQDQNLQKAMQVNDTPCTFVIDGGGKVVWMHNSYMEGDEDKVFEELERIK
ncbi:MAG TPA: TlpA disulfide reductase family protein [Bacteroidia bacterium]|nr:TlpA disulfide reductase family protein [Bacteroidia bacterium]